MSLMSWLVISLMAFIIVVMFAILYLEEIKK